MLEEKLAKLRAFNSNSRTVFTKADELYQLVQKGINEATHSVSKTKITDDQEDGAQPHTGKEIVDPDIPTTMPQQEEPISPDQQQHREED